MIATRHHALAQFEAFLEETGWSASRFGRAAVRDQSFIFRLRRGEGVSLSTIERAESFVREARGGDAATEAGPARPGSEGAGKRTGAVPEAGPAPSPQTGGGTRAGAVPGAAR